MGVSCEVWMLSPRNRPEGMTWAFASSFCPLTPAPFVSRLWRKACCTRVCSTCYAPTRRCNALLPNNVLKTGLLQRNTTKPHTLLGGTYWSVQMALEQQKPGCVYTDQWYQFDYPQQRFVPCHPPYLHPQNTTIVGSRRIILQMTQELHNLFQRTIQLETRPLLNFWFH